MTGTSEEEVCEPSPTSNAKINLHKPAPGGPRRPWGGGEVSEEVKDKRGERRRGGRVESLCSLAS